jgi:hypothetical protein
MRNGLDRTEFLVHHPVMAGGRAIAVVLSLLMVLMPVSAQSQTGSAGTTGDETAAGALSPEERLFIEIEGRPVLHPEDVLFYGPRAPRSHFQGERYVSEGMFFEIAGDEEAARKSRTFRGVNIGLGLLTMMSFFAGMALFSTADDVDLAAAGLNSGMTDRGFSLVLIGGSLVPAAVLTVRRQQWASLEYTYQTMVQFNENNPDP